MNAAPWTSLDEYRVKPKVDRANCLATTVTYLVTPGKTVTAGNGTLVTSTVSIVVIIGLAAASSKFMFIM